MLQCHPKNGSPVYETLSWGLTCTVQGNLSNPVGEYVGETLLLMNLGGLSGASYILHTIYHLKVRQNDEKGDIEFSPRYKTALATALVADHNHPHLSLLHPNKPPPQSHQQQTWLIAGNTRWGIYSKLFVINSPKITRASSLIAGTSAQRTTPLFHNIQVLLFGFLLVSWSYYVTFPFSPISTCKISWMSQVFIS